MDFLVNDLSLHGQFHKTTDFVDAVERLMDIRREIRRFGCELMCHRNLANAQVTPDLAMAQAVQTMPREKQKAWVQWLSKVGPYWLDDRQHREGDWLEATGELVTDTAIGEAGFCRLHNFERELVSVNPSKWLVSPIQVIWKIADDRQREINVVNHWSLDSVSRTLKDLPPTFHSWRSLEQHVRRTCDRLSFAPNAFDSLDGHPFKMAGAERIVVLLETLNTARGCFDDEGNRTPEGDRIFASHFAGDKAWFSDSSDTEKHEFRDQLTFPYPGKPGEYLFCTWHGKVKTPQIRIHFSWPVSATLPLYIVYVGPKITKR